MTDRELFDCALKLAGGNMAELARKCRTTRQNVFLWNRGTISELTRYKLKEYLDNSGEDRHEKA